MLPDYHPTCEKQLTFPGRKYLKNSHTSYKYIWFWNLKAFFCNMFSKNPKVNQVNFLPHSETTEYLIFDKEHVFLFKTIGYCCVSVTCAGSQELYWAECSTVWRTPALQAGDWASPSPFLWYTGSNAAIKNIPVSLKTTLYITMS